MSDETLPTQRWSEDASATFIDTADLFVPARADQIATLVALIPARRDESFTVVELASGDGTLAQAILDAFPACRYLALDGSDVMREALRTRLTAYGDRAEVRPFRMEQREWRDALPSPLRCVLSSLCVHHLEGEAKRDLFADMVAHLEPGGPAPRRYRRAGGPPARLALRPAIRRDRAAAEPRALRRSARLRALRGRTVELLRLHLRQSR